MVETLESSNILALEEADYSTDVDAVLLDALDKRSRKIKLVPWVVHAPTYEIFLERKEKAIARSGVSQLYVFTKSDAAFKFVARHGRA
ncbi:hypothetical protein H6F67_00090 [Microcoleus sp. FACHB-1515]|uniref:hypothetical protein n=1 Tax=Cyanophyceae TaxID=3028117 RepID=UPI0016891A58|nr:hypothetical protein [Microcoleus sp. FACHB-1515]MBD2088274.1 hypothetical protein [Microcoleus sp. FACHB-1515]